MNNSVAPAIIFTDDGWILSATEPPVTADDLRAKVVDGYAGNGGAFWWSLGDHEVYQYETERGEIFGQGRTSFDDGMRSFVHSPTPGVMPRIAENIRGLIAEDGGPMTILTRQSREAGLPFFPRVRMNSHYDMDPNHPAYGRFRRERPDLLIGRPGESIPEGTIEWGIKTGLDFTFPEVREHRLSIVEEVVERFDVDGVELDFMRHPAFFRPDEAYGSRYLMTNLVARARRMIDEAGSRRGRNLQLAVRVPPTLYDSARIGLDAGEWIAERLVDVVVVGGGFIPFETPIGEFTAAASGTGCLVYGCIEGTVTADERKHEIAGGTLAGGRRGRSLPVQLLHHVAGVEPQDRAGAYRPRGACRARQALRDLPPQVIRRRGRPQHRVQVRQPRHPASRPAGSLSGRRRVARPEARPQTRLERGKRWRRRAPSAPAGPDAGAG